MDIQQTQTQTQTQQQELDPGRLCESSEAPELSISSSSSSPPATFPGPTGMATRNSTLAVETRPDPPAETSMTDFHPLEPNVLASIADTALEAAPGATPMATTATALTATAAPQLSSPLPSPGPRLSPMALTIPIPQTSGPSVDEPPPYSPTRTILPQYFTLVPLPIRTYTIQAAPCAPFLLDFWLHDPQIQVSPGASMAVGGPRPPELKYSLVRPVQPDLTAHLNLSPTNNLPPLDSSCIPPLALVSAANPNHWIWWTSDALVMMIFGRHFRNIPMDWKWKRTAANSSVQRLIGCSFTITSGGSERGFCWKEGTGRPFRNRGTASGAPMVGGSAGVESAQSGHQQPQQRRRPVWQYWGHRQAPVLPTTAATAGSRNGNNTSHDIPMQQATTLTPAPVSEQELTEQQQRDLDDAESEEFDAFHLREEKPDGSFGKTVAIYKASRGADRERDRPERTAQVEIYAELGDRVESVILIMATRLEDQFNSAPGGKQLARLRERRHRQQRLLLQQQQLHNQNQDSDIVLGEGMDQDLEEGRHSQREVRTQWQQWKYVLKWIFIVFAIALIAFLTQRK